MSVAFPVFVALATGMALVLQPLVNARLAQVAGGAFWASGISATVTATLAFICAALVSGQVSFGGTLQRVPWWTWTGGILGAVALVGLTYAVPRIGATAVVVLVVLAQLVTALLIDHSGLLEHRVPVTATRLLGAFLVLVGATLVLAVQR